MKGLSIHDSSATNIRTGIQVAGQRSTVMADAEENIFIRGRIAQLRSRLKAEQAHRTKIEPQEHGIASVCSRIITHWPAETEHRTAISQTADTKNVSESRTAQIFGAYYDRSRKLEMIGRYPITPSGSLAFFVNPESAERKAIQRSFELKDLERKLSHKVTTEELHDDLPTLET
ncbi:hypothetical protein FA15DRAFT_717053 [Coprinopsis marcescibilis]|uniref:Uncharacterized protein n=1 Tax=Coprinopsis marcescibilis TaxID=230819 RepID=A0A5C3KMF7_COPMA|nr:hypothetical protein FA15DRAFT_717053 [Coprinopsis marcescibilis]